MDSQTQGTKCRTFKELHYLGHSRRQMYSRTTNPYIQQLACTAGVTMLVTRIIGSCPACKAADAFGNVLIARDRVLRGCKVCRYSEEIPLPQLAKKVIYLDQFFFSGAFREKDARFAEAAELIKKAASNQLLVAPYSSIHEDETFQWRGF